MSEEQEEQIEIDNNHDFESSDISEPGEIIREDSKPQTSVIGETYIQILSQCGQYCVTVIVSEESMKNTEVQH